MKFDREHFKQSLHLAVNYLQRWLEPENLQQLRPNLSFQTSILASFALLASVLLGITHCSTQTAIEQRLTEDLQKSLAEVIPAESYDNDLLHDTLTISSKGYSIGAEQILVYQAKKAGKVTAISFKLSAPDGYSGAIDMLIGINRDGTILGVRVLNHKETPGLGDKIELAKSNWILNFNGRSLNNLAAERWAVKKDGGEFDQFSGATITPRKSVQAIYRSLQWFKAHQAELIR
jgi:electron transport complex protein RnfG